MSNNFNPAAPFEGDLHVDIIDAVFVKAHPINKKVKNKKTAPHLHEPSFYRVTEITLKRAPIVEMQHRGKTYTLHKDDGQMVVSVTPPYNGHNNTKEG